MLTVHVGHWRARHAAGVEQDAHDSIRMEARSPGSECDDFRDTRIAVVVDDHRWSDGSEVVGHGAFIVDKGNREPSRAEVSRRLAARPKVDDEVEVAVAGRNGGGKRRNQSVV